MLFSRSPRSTRGRHARRYSARVPDPSPSVTPPGWSPQSWKTRPSAHAIAYPDADALEAAVRALSLLPPLVTSWEIERLRDELAQAEAGERFILQGGDCAETFDDCRPDFIANKLKILLQMSLVIVHGLKRPVTRIGRFAGQYAKPRSSMVETRSGPGGVPVTLPSYFGDLINRAAFTPEARRLDPALMIKGHEHAAMTLNFIRSLVEGGFADFHHPEYWNLDFLAHGGLPGDVRADYERTAREMVDGLRFMEALGERAVDQLTRVEFFTSHEGLNLHYEAAQTRTVPRRHGWYDLSTHLPWIGDRTRAVDGAHVEHFRGVRNPVGVKLGPSATVAQVEGLWETLNPGNERGRLVFITRMGASRASALLPPLVDALAKRRAAALWICDPMHGNGTVLSDGLKTRSFDAILEELEATCEIFERAGVPLGGVHFELTGEDVAECLGGAAGVREEDLRRHYASPCDPRLNYRQSLEMAFLMARRLAPRR